MIPIGSRLCGSQTYSNFTCKAPVWLVVGENELRSTFKLEFSIFYFIKGLWLSLEAT